MLRHDLMCFVRNRFATALLTLSLAALSLTALGLAATATSAAGLATNPLQALSTAPEPALSKAGLPVATLAKWEEAPADDCPMTPPFTEAPVPRNRYVGHTGETAYATWDQPPEGAWTYGAARATSVAVAAEGPSGSGRYWYVTVRLRPSSASASGSAAGVPSDTTTSGGLRFMTSTRGWRLLPKGGVDRLAPLSWVDDVDEDGNDEVVVWSSFTARMDTPVRPPSGLIAWVYDVTSDDRLVLNRPATQAMAGTLAAAYRTGDEETRGPQGQEREAVAAGLDALAGGHCTGW